MLVAVQGVLAQLESNSFVIVACRVKGGWVKQTKPSFLYFYRAFQANPNTISIFNTIFKIMT